MANLVVATGLVVTGPASTTPHANRNTIVVALNNYNATSTSTVAVSATSTLTNTVSASSTPTASDG